MTESLSERFERQVQADRVRRTWIRRVVMAVVLLAAGVYALPVTRDSLAWSRCGEDPGSFLRYLSHWPNGRHAGEARRCLDDALWGVVESHSVLDHSEGRPTREELTNHKSAVAAYLRHCRSGSRIERARELYAWLDTQEGAYFVGGLTKALEFLDSYPDSEYFSQARELAWELASASRDPERLRILARALPDDDLSVQARSMIDAVGSAKFEAAVAASDPQRSLASFVSQFPEHAKVADARLLLRRLDDGAVDVVELRAKDDLTVSVEGLSIGKVRVELRNQRAVPLSCSIPAGTAFVGRNTMISLVRRTSIVPAASTRSLEISVAFARLETFPVAFTRKLDFEDPDMALHLTPFHLECLLPAIRQSKSHGSVLHAAIWIVGQDPSYEWMQSLESVTGPFAELRATIASAEGRRPGSALFSPVTVAEALKLLSECDVDFRKTAVWRDRKELAESLPAGELSVWLRQND